MLDEDEGNNLGTLQVPGGGMNDNIDLTADKQPFCFSVISLYGFNMDVHLWSLQFQYFLDLRLSPSAGFSVLIGVVALKYGATSGKSKKPHQEKASTLVSVLEGTAELLKNEATIVPQSNHPPNKIYN